MILCGCIAEKDIDSCLSEALSLKTDIFEHRLDYLDNHSRLHQIYCCISHPVIATMRPSWEGGESHISDAKRASILIDALNAGCAGVDVELDMQSQHRDKVIAYGHDHKAVVIVSKHFFDTTPPLAELLNIYKKARETGADLIKIVTFAQKESDCDTVLSLYDLVPKGTLVSFAMGDKGKVSRAKALLLGSPLMYVSGEKSTAPGQMDADSLRKTVVGVM